MSKFAVIETVDEFLGMPERKVINLDLVKEITAEELWHNGKPTNKTLLKYWFIDGSKVEYIGTLDDAINTIHRCERDGRPE